MEVKDRVLVLRSTRYEDRHLIITALSEHHGKITAMARSAIQSRRFGGGLELFALSDWEWHAKEGSDLYSLRGATLKHEFEKIRRQMLTFSAASLMVEIVLRGTPAQDHSPELFKLLVNGLAKLERLAETQHAEESLTVVARFLLKYLHWAGHFPRVTVCVQCGRSPFGEGETPTRLGLSVDPAGILCGSCSTAASQVSSTALIYLIEAHPRPISETLPPTESASAWMSLVQRLVEMLQFHIPGFDRAPLKSIRSLEISA